MAALSTTNNNSQQETQRNSEPATSTQQNTENAWGAQNLGRLKNQSVNHAKNNGYGTFGNEVDASANDLEQEINNGLSPEEASSRREGVRSDARSTAVAFNDGQELTADESAKVDAWVEENTDGFADNNTDFDEFLDTVFNQAADGADGVDGANGANGVDGTNGETPETTEPTNEELIDDAKEFSESEDGKNFNEVLVNILQEFSELLKKDENRTEKDDDRLGLIKALLQLISQLLNNEDENNDKTKLLELIVELISQLASDGDDQGDDQGDDESASGEEPAGDAPANDTPTGGGNSGNNVTVTINN